MSRLIASTACVFALLLSVTLVGCGGDSDTPSSQPPAASNNDAPSSKPARSEPVKNTVAAEPVDKFIPEPDPPKGRQWKDANGKVLAVGEFISVFDGYVGIETADGLGRRIAVADLSDEDQAFVDSKRPKEAEPTPDMAENESDQDDARAGHSGDIQAKPSDESAYYQQQKVVIPFDFVSEFDEGRYGKMVGDMMWKKLDRQGGVVIPESMIDVRDLCGAIGVTPSPETPLAAMKELVRERFAADIGIWGRVERVAGNEWDVYDLTIRCVDFSGSEPKTIYEAINVRTNTVSEIPHLYAAEMIDKLYGREPGEEIVDPIAEKNWIENPNLVRGGDFQQGRGGVPIGWERGGGQLREPLGNLVKWLPDTSDPSNKVIRFTFGADVGDGYGVMYYSEPFPIEEGAKYRFQCRWRTNGPAVKVFIKCYDLMESEYQRTGAGRASSSRGYVPEEGQLRECYRAQFNMKGEGNQWQTHTQDFTPKHTKYSPKWGKVDLYAYLGAGVVEFDDVVIKQIVPASASDRIKDPKHSMESSVTLEDMRKNEERARQPEDEEENPLEPR